MQFFARASQSDAGRPRCKKIRCCFTWQLPELHAALHNISARGLSLALRPAKSRSRIHWLHSNVCWTRFLSPGKKCGVDSAPRGLEHDVILFLLQTPTQLDFFNRLYYWIFEDWSRQWKILYRNGLNDYNFVYQFHTIFGPRKFNWLRRWPDLKFSRDKFRGKTLAEILRDLTISYIAVASENFPSLAANQRKYFPAVFTEIMRCMPT